MDDWRVRADEANKELRATGSRLSLLSGAERRNKLEKKGFEIVKEDEVVIHPNEENAFLLRIGFVLKKDDKLFYYYNESRKIKPYDPQKVRLHIENIKKECDD